MVHTNYALNHNYVRPEQFCFRNKEECIKFPHLNKRNLPKKKI